jgi:hypothetical protein
VTLDPKLPLEGDAAAPAPPSSARTEATTLLDPPVSATRPHSAMQLWLHRTSVFLFVLISAVAGVLLVILPWTPEWTDNYLLLSFPWLRTFVSTGFSAACAAVWDYSISGSASGKPSTTTNTSKNRAARVPKGTARVSFESV